MSLYSGDGKRLARRHGVGRRGGKRLQQKNGRKLLPVALLLVCAGLLTAGAII